MRKTRPLRRKEERGRKGVTGHLVYGILRFWKLSWIQNNTMLQSCKPVYCVNKDLYWDCQILLFIVYFIPLYIVCCFIYYSIYNVIHIFFNIFEATKYACHCYNLASRRRSFVHTCSLCVIVRTQTGRICRCLACLSVLQFVVICFFVLIFCHYLSIWIY